jgi:hypothetical protein
MTDERHEDLERARKDLEEEHEELRKLVARLRDARDPATLLPVLESLHPKLRDHFEHEEFPGGFYDSIGALAAEYSTAVRELVDDHYLFLAAIRGLADQVRRHREGAIDELLRQAATLADRLRAHEDKELKLVAQVQRR